MDNKFKKQYPLMYNRRKAQVLELALEKGELTPKTISKELGLEIHASRNLARRLSNQGLLEKVGQDWKDTVGANLYSITGKGRKRYEWLNEKLEEESKEELFEELCDMLGEDFESLEEGARILLDEYLASKAINDELSGKVEDIKKKHRSLKDFMEQLLSRIEEIDEMYLEWYTFDDLLEPDLLEPEDEQELLEILLERGALLTAGQEKCDQDIEELVDEIAERLEKEPSLDKEEAISLLLPYTELLLEEYDAAKAELEEQV